MKMIQMSTAKGLIGRTLEKDGVRELIVHHSGMKKHLTSWSEKCFKEEISLRKYEDQLVPICGERRRKVNFLFL